MTKEAYDEIADLITKKKATIARAKKRIGLAEKSLEADKKFLATAIETEEALEQLLLDSSCYNEF